MSTQKLIDKLESCIVNLTLGSFAAAELDIQQVAEEFANLNKNTGNESSIKDIEEFMKNINYVMAEFWRKQEQQQALSKSDYRQALLAFFRCLRNCWASNRLLQDALGSNLDFLAEFRKLLDAVFERHSDDEGDLILCIAVQFLCNATSGHSSVDSRVYVWDYFHCQFLRILKNEVSSDRLLNCTCFIVRNCILAYSRANHFFLDDQNNNLTLRLVVQACMERENIENGMLAVEQMLKVTKLFDGLYCKLEPKERLFVLEILKSRLLDWEKNLGATTTLAPSEVADNSDLPVCKSNLIFLANRVSDERAEFQKLKYKDAGHNEGLLVLVKELEVLSIVTAFDSYNRLQDTPKLLRFAVDLLRDIHEAGRRGSAPLAVLTKTSSDTDIDRNHPAYGLRRDLMRIIGNMVFRNLDNQNLVRMLNGIPLILEQTIVDDRNPFITQWTIMAVRNLCERNRENIEFIRALKLQGVANTVELLREHGIVADVEDERVIIRPPPSIPNSPTEDSPGSKPSGYQ